MNEWRPGWKVVLASAVGVGTGLNGIPFYSLGIFIKPLSHAFGWSRASIAGAGLCIGLGAALLAPLVGRLADRFGVRPVALVSLIGLALGYLAVASVGPSLVGYYASWIFLAVAGAGTSPVVWTRAVNSWFDRSRGLALGLTLIGTGLAAMLAPMLIAGVIASAGWRQADLAICGFILCIALPVTFFLFREKTIALPKQAAGNGTMLRAALRSGRFWRNGLGFFLVSMAVASVIVHLSPMLTDRRIDPSIAARFVGLLGLMVTLGRIATGLLVDRLHAPLIAMIFFLLAALGCLVMLDIGNSFWATGLAVTLFGLAAGAEVDMLAYLTARYFGVAEYGQIYGAQFMFFGVGAALGPLAAGWVFGLTGGYDVMLIAAAVLLVLGGLSILSLGAYPLIDPSVAGLREADPPR